MVTLQTPVATFTPPISRPSRNENEGMGENRTERSKLVLTGACCPAGPGDEAMGLHIETNDVSIAMAVLSHPC